MAFKKAKGQQDATSSNSLDEIKDFLNAKFNELGTRLTLLEKKLYNVTKDIHLKLNASTQTRKNREEIEGLQFRQAVLNKTVSNQAITIHQLDIEVEDLKNRSLIKTPVFRNIEKHQSQKTLDDKKMVLANEIAKTMQDFPKEAIIKNIERAHRLQLPKLTPLLHQHHPFLLSKLQTGTSWKKKICQYKN